MKEKWSCSMVRASFEREVTNCTNPHRLKHGVTFPRVLQSKPRFGGYPAEYIELGLSVCVFVLCL